MGNIPKCLPFVEVQLTLFLLESSVLGPMTVDKKNVIPVKKEIIRIRNQPNFDNNWIMLLNPVRF